MLGMHSTINQDNISYRQFITISHCESLYASISVNHYMHLAAELVVL